MARLYKKKASSPVATTKRPFKYREGISPDKARDHLFARVRPHADDSNRTAVEPRDDILTGATTPAKSVYKPYQSRSKRTSAVTALSSSPSTLNGSHDDNKIVRQQPLQLSKRTRDPSNEGVRLSTIRSPSPFSTYRVSEQILDDDFHILRPSSQSQEAHYDQAQSELTVLRTTTRLYKVHQLSGTTPFDANTQKSHGEKPQETTEQPRDEQPFPEQYGFSFEPSRSQRGRLLDYQHNYQSRHRGINGQVEEVTENDTNDQGESFMDSPEYLDYPQHPSYTEDIHPRHSGIKRKRSQTRDEESSEDIWRRVEERVLKKQNYMNTNPFKPYQYSHARRRRT